MIFCIDYQDDGFRNLVSGNRPQKKRCNWIVGDNNNPDSHDLLD